MTAAMTPLAASSAVRLPRAPPRRRIGWPVALSVLLHLALLAVAIVAAQHKRTPPQAVPPASVAMVFEGGGNTPPSIANPAPVSPNRQASPAPQASEPPPPPPAPPVEQTQPLPIAPPAEIQPPTVVPPTQEVAPPAPETTPPAQEATPPPVPAPPPEPAPAPQATPQPLPEVTAPPSAAPATEASAPEAVPLPPPAPVPVPQATPHPAPLPPVPVPAQQVRPPPAPPRLPRPREAARPLSPPRAGPAFPAPMDFSLGPRATGPQVAPPRPHESPGTIDLSFAPIMGGGDITQLHPQGKGDDVGEDWFNEVAAWWLRHRFYPSEAARLLQEGDVTLHLVVGRDGRVQAVDIEQKSGSPWLDLGALAIFRDAKLPPLPPNVRDPNVTVSFDIHYVIIR